MNTLIMALLLRWSANNMAVYALCPESQDSNDRGHDDRCNRGKVLIWNTIAKNTRKNVWKIANGLYNHSISGNITMIKISYMYA